MFSEIEEEQIQLKLLIPQTSYTTHKKQKLTENSQ
jgi:hypothetical protein